MADPSYDWCHNLFGCLKEHGKWAVPRSGLIFQREGTALILVNRLPGFDPDVQQADFLSIISHFQDAGIDCYEA